MELLILPENDNVKVRYSELNNKAQSMLPGLVELLIHGYGDKDGGWGSSVFSH